MNAHPGSNNDLYSSVSSTIDNMPTKYRMVAVDNVGAGIGEIVLIATGSAARIGCNMEDAPVDAAIVGIIDDGIGLE